MKRFVIASVMLVASALVASVSGQDLRPVAVGELEESLAPAAEISGTAIVGLALVGAFDPTKNVVTALLPGDWKGQDVCARVVSADGRYLAQRGYLLPNDWKMDLVPLEFPTRRAREVVTGGKQDFALSVIKGICKGASGEPALALASWNAIEQTDMAVEVLVNSLRSTETYLLAGDVYIPCTPVEHERRTAFDMSCNVPRSLLASETSLRFSLNRLKRGAPLPVENFTIELH
jgi:hypothetical protein